MTNESNGSVNDVAAACESLDDFMAAFTDKMREQFIERGVTRFDLVFAVVTDKGTSVAGTNEDRHAMAEQLKSALRTVRTPLATVIANGYVPRREPK